MWNDRRSRVAVLAALVAGALAVLAASAAGRSAAVAAHMRPAGIPSVKVGPLSAFQHGSSPSCATSIGTFNCYAPSDIQSVYDYPSGRNAPTGAGQTIVVVEAYATDYEQATGSSLNDDLAAFDETFGIPAPPGGGVDIVAGPSSTCESDEDCSGDALGWAGEISLDVEWAHAMAPAAKIVVASASSDSTLDINSAEASILPHYPGAIVSQSFGSDEAGDLADLDSEKDMHAIFQAAIGDGDTLIASAGDWGATDGDPYIMASYPASDPLVLAIGGTQGHPYPDGLWRHGRYGDEETWNEPQFGDLAGGGAPSVVWNAPSWQRGLTRYSSGRTPMRTVPDVSYDAAIEGGVLTVQSLGGVPNIWISGGTSVGTPQWAAIIALADQLRSARHQPGLGVAAEPIYELAQDRRTYQSDFHDIVLGNNAQGSGNQPLQRGDLGFEASPGYDLATGLGTPDVSRLIADLASRQRGTPSPGPGGPGNGQHGGRGHHGRMSPGR